MKAEKEYMEGPEAFRRFDAFMGKLLTVPREVIQAREEEYRKQAALNPKKRGPKPKSAASHGAGAAPKA